MVLNPNHQTTNSLNLAYFKFFLQASLYDSIFPRVLAIFRRQGFICADLDGEETMSTQPLPSPNSKLLNKFSLSNGRIYLGNVQFLVKISLFPSKSCSKFNLSLHLHRFPRPVSLSASSISENGGNFDEESMVVEAQEAVSEILQEVGVSKEESIEIASKSPKYVKMLIDGVRELDELSLWKSWTVEKEDVDALSFKKKVFYMAKEKGDKGIVPFLESAGLNPLSSMHIARYLVSESLPKVMRKVTFVKELLFSGSDDEGLIGRNARRMMTQLSIVVDEDVQQTLSFFEKMEARRGGLSILDSKDACFQYLVGSFPRLFTRSVEKHLKPLVKFLEGFGVPKGRVRVVLLLFPPIIFYDIERDIKPRIHALKKGVGVEEKDIGKMLVKYPWILSTSIRENYEEILSFFELEMVPQVSICKAIKSWPHLLGCSTRKMRSMAQEFGELNVRNKKLGPVIAASPQLLLKKPDEFLRVVSFLVELGFDEESVGRILSRTPQIFPASVENTLKRNLKFLDDIGIREDYLSRVIRKYPELLTTDIDRNLWPRINYLRNAGLAKWEVASMVRRFSPLLGYGIDEVLRPKHEFLVNTMKKPVKDVVEYPRYFSYSLEKKIKPRFWVLKGRDLDCSLQEMLGKNDEDFAADYMGIGTPLTSTPPSPSPPQ